MQRFCDKVQTLCKDLVPIKNIFRITTHKKHLDVRFYFNNLFIDLFAVLFWHYHIENGQTDFVLIILEPCYSVFPICSDNY